MFQGLRSFYNRYAWFFRGVYRFFSTVFHILWKTLWVIYKCFLAVYHVILKFLSFLD